MFACLLFDQNTLKENHYLYSLPHTKLFVSIHNGCRINVEIMAGENLSSKLLANLDITYWSVHSSSRRGGDGGYRYFNQLQVLLF